MNNTNAIWVDNEPPVKKFNLCVNGVRVWSGEEWPNVFLDVVARACRLTGAKFSFCDSTGRELGY